MVSGFGPKRRTSPSHASPTATSRPSRIAISSIAIARGGGRRTASAGLKICWGNDYDECARLAHSGCWRSSGVPGELSQQLPTPAFEQASSLVSVQSVAEKIPCGPAVEPIVRAVQDYVDAGFDRVYINQVGPRQEEFFEFFSTDLAPALADVGMRPGRNAVGG